MIIHTKELFFDRINQLYQEKTPFFFTTDYEGTKMEVLPLAELKALMNVNDSPIYFQTPISQFLPTTKKNNDVQDPPTFTWKINPIPFAAYEQSFLKVKASIQAGRSYLVNLTCSTPVESDLSLKQLFNLGRGKYKLYYRGQFIHFSPEPFIRIRDGKIYTYPMKGTIDAAKADAAQQLMQNEKEKAEQHTIVDLLRNDLSQVATRVKVDDFRYLEKLHTNQKDLYTISSAISGELRTPYLDCPGAIMERLLPAGSICGAPKTATREIIQSAEQHQRNFYTGIWGIFDGKQIDSCVIIRYLEKTPAGFVFKSGGGITAMSDPKAEYQEMIDKVYIPL